MSSLLNDKVKLKKSTSRPVHHEIIKIISPDAQHEITKFIQSHKKGSKIKHHIMTYMYTQFQFIQKLTVHIIGGTNTIYVYHKKAVYHKTAFLLGST